jgi:hypothetical protein
MKNWTETTNSYWKFPGTSKNHHEYSIRILQAYENGSESELDLKKYRISWDLSLMT